MKQAAKFKRVLQLLDTTGGLTLKGIQEAYEKEHQERVSLPTIAKAKRFWVQVDVMRSYLKWDQQGRFKLEEELAAAIAREDYERAAQLRDMLKNQ